MNNVLVISKFEIILKGLKYIIIVSKISIVDINYNKILHTIFDFG